MNDRRLTHPIRCPKCGKLDAYERRSAFASDTSGGRSVLWQFYCPDCNNQFYLDSIPKVCGNCGTTVRRFEERCRGLCTSCVVASWPPEKRAAMNRLIGMAFQEPRPTDAAKDAAIDGAIKHLDG